MKGVGLSFVAFPFAIFWLLLTLGSSEDCTWNGYSFSAIARTNYKWSMKTKIGNTTLKYDISICSPLPTPVPKECKDAAICRQNGSETVSVGNHSATLNITEGSDNDLWWTFYGGTCAENTAAVYKTSINFKCGKDLGSPVFLGSSACDTFIEWYSSVACKKDITEAANFVPCYVYGAQGEKYDLSPLIKSGGAYRVETMDSTDFFINVCRDINPEGESAYCNKDGSSACRVVGSTPTGVGKPTSPLMRTTDNKLYLHYAADGPGPGCTQQSSTAIYFICPQRGMNKEPRLTSDEECQYKVEWETEFACKEETLISKTCSLKEEQHGINLDLSPLGGQSHSVRHDAYTYVFGLCSSSTIPCKGLTDSNTMGCQTKPTDASFGKVIGNMANQTLRYSDRQLTLTYKGGEVCSSGFSRTTVINFHCNLNAENEGHGKPVFGTEDSCSYVFDWETKYACVESIFHGTCLIQHGRQNFDLSPLKVDGDEEYWQVVVGDGPSSQGSYYLNVCGGITQPIAGATCPAGSAICFIGKDGSVKNLGQYVSSPKFNETLNTIHLEYTGGDTCTGNKSIQTHITMRCRPGDLEAAPVLNMVSADGCFYELEWETAAACVTSTKRGSNCSVFDDTLGIYFDLNALKSDGDGYSVTNKKSDHTYYLDVCTKVTHGSCKDKNAGVCQISGSDASQVFNAGQPSSELYYQDGFVNLTYTSGDTYHTNPPISRSSEIMFICDHGAGKGKPEFQGETAHTYSFIWRTSYVCPQAMIECVATNPTTYEQIDLARLVKNKDNWEVETDQNGTKRKFYLNICHSLNPTPRSQGCSRFASVCSTKIENGLETIEHENLGQTIAKPVMKDNEVVLTYSSSTSACTDDNGAKKPFITKIHFVCETTTPTEAPEFMGQQGNCEFSFMWRTREACSVGTVKQNSTKNNCSIADPNSNHVFNMLPLKRNASNPYIVHSSVGRFTMNICGSVGPAKCGKLNDKEPAVCRETTFVGDDSGQMAFNEAGGLSLTYTAKPTSGDDTKVVVNFICDQNEPTGEPKMKESIGNTYIFEFHTAIACRPEPVECVVFDKVGNRYDLSPLTRPGGSWRVADSRASNLHLTYYINVCAPIAGVPSCTGGNLGGCQVSATGSSWSTGYVQSKPVAVGNGTITLRYLGGKLCHKGKPTESHRSTRINFFCSNKEEDPVFEGETEQCEYIFSWRTPSACSLKRVIGSDCAVEDPLYRTRFSLENLKGNGNNYEVMANGVKFELNVCAPLISPPDECKDAGGCQTVLNGNHYNMGMPNGDLTYEDGELSLIYHDGQACHGNKFKRETHIKFVCDHNVFGKAEGARRFINETGECAYQFVWTTSLACMPFHVVQCGTADAQGNSYEFSPLTLTADNYEVYLPVSHQKIILNVCTTLVHKKGLTCPPYSAACVIDLDETDPKKKFKKIGGLTDAPVQFKNGVMTITYTTDEKCPADPRANYSTVITLACDKEVGLHPEFLFVESCAYHFMWKTPYACSNSDHQEQVSGDCTVVNPVTGYKFDLGRWKTESGYTVTDSRGLTYKLNVCSPLGNSACGSKSGACQTTSDGKNYNAGNATNQVHFHQGMLYLNYTGGDICHHSNTPRNTLLQFVCGAPGTGNGQPQFIGESEDCTYYVKWSSEYVCENQDLWTCSVDKSNGEVIDLSPLISKSGNYPVISHLSTDSSYYINICRPLGTVQGGNCPALAAACSVGKESKSLGRVTSKPVWDATTNQVVVTYSDGDQCDNQPDKKFTTKIILQCQEGHDVGMPQLISKTDCQHVFLWTTNVVCTNGGAITPSTKCIVNNPRTSQDFDMKMFVADEPYQIESALGKYYINLCDGGMGPASDLQECTGSAVCFVSKQNKGTSFGLESVMTAVWVGDDMKLTINGGSNCSSSSSDDNKAKTIINFVCDESVNGKGAPVLSMRTGCDVVLDWRTSLICPVKQKECLVHHDHKIFDLGVLSHETGSWKFDGADKSSYWLNICSGVHQGGQNCPPNAAVCQKTKDGRVRVLGTVAEQKLSHKDGKIVVEYEGGNACPSGNSKVKIYLPCGETIGNPEALPRVGESCLFEFLWKTRLACPTARTQVSVKEEKVQNPRTGGIMDLKSLREKIIKSRSEDIQYYFALTGSLDKPGCENAAVCKEAEDGSTVVIGSADSRVFYMEDDMLEMVSTSVEICEPHGQKRSTASFQLHCSRANITTQPKLIYQSSKCDYFFMWYTPEACALSEVNYQVSVQPHHANAAAAVSITLLVLIIILALGIILGKRERREAISNRIRSLFSTSYVGRSMSYSRLSSGDDESHSLLGSRSRDMRSGDTSDDDMIL